LSYGTANEFRHIKTSDGIELVYQNKVKISEKPRITFAKEAYQLLLQTYDPNEIEL
jgi:hypothetical protein